MSSNPSLHKQRDQAEEVRRQYTADVDRVRRDRDLSDAGRQRRLAEIYTTAQATLHELSEAEKTHLDGRKSNLERELFGARGAARGLDGAAHAISARDASDRAAQVQTPAAASELLSRAEADGDELLARAVARRCIHGSDASMSRQAAESWDEVTRVYLDTRPRLMPVVEELAEIERMTKRQILSPFSLAQPHGVEPQHLHAAASSRNPEEIRPVDGRPLVDPRTTETSHAQRQAWAEAAGTKA